MNHTWSMRDGFNSFRLSNWWQRNALGAWKADHGLRMQQQIAVPIYFRHFFFLKYDHRVSFVTKIFSAVMLTPELAALKGLWCSSVTAHLSPKDQASKDCQSLCSSEVEARNKRSNLVKVIYKKKKKPKNPQVLSIIVNYVQNCRLPTGLKLIIGFSSNLYLSKNISHLVMY